MTHESCLEIRIIDDKAKHGNLIAVNLQPKLLPDFRIYVLRLLSLRYGFVAEKCSKKRSVFFYSFVFFSCINRFHVKHQISSSICFFHTFGSYQALQQQERAMMGSQPGAEGEQPVAEEEAVPIRGGAGYGQLQRKINETGEVPKTEV